MVQLAIIPDCFRNDNETMEMFLKEQSKGKKIFMARQIATDPIFISYDVLWYIIIFMAKLFLYCDYFRYDITKLWNLLKQNSHGEKSSMITFRD